MTSLALAAPLPPPPPLCCAAVPSSSSHGSQRPAAAWKRSLRSLCSSSASSSGSSRLSCSCWVASKPVPGGGTAECRRMKVSVGRWRAESAWDGRRAPSAPPKPASAACSRPRSPASSDRAPSALEYRASQARAVGGRRCRPLRAHAARASEMVFDEAQEADRSRIEQALPHVAYESAASRPRLTHRAGGLPLEAVGR